MSGTNVTLQHDQQYFTGSSASPLQGKALLRAVQNEIAGILSGAKSCSAFEVAPNGADPLPAAAIMAMGSAGTQTLTIGGVAIAITYATSTTNSAGLMVTAINASSDALISKIVQAGRLGMVFTIDDTVAANDTVTILGVTLTAVEANPLGLINQYVFSDSDGAVTATNLAACINAHPVLSRYVKAAGVSTALYVMCLTAAFPTGPTAPPNVVLSSNSVSCSPSGATLAARGNVIVSSFRRDVLANHVTCAASGTGASMLNSTTRLIGGAGGAVTSLLAYP